jgi:ankyrin repeat protein
MHPFIEAIHQADVNTVRKMLDSEPFLVNYLDEDYEPDLPIHIAASTHQGKASRKVIEILLEHGANPNARGCDEQTSLHEAALYGSFDAAECLLHAGADPNAIDRFGESVLHKVGLTRTPNPGIFGLLLMHGAAIDLFSAVLFRRLDWATWVLRDHPDRVRQHTRCDPLDFAIINQDTNIVKLLVTHGADLNPTDKEPPLSIAVSSTDSSAEIVDYLISHGADVNGRPYSDTHPGSLPLKTALLVHNDAVVRLLRKHGAM